MSSGPELPVIYENPRFDKATPTLWPVFDRAARFTLVILMEWGTLTLIEDAPRYVKLATVIVAALGLAVHESWPWLRMRDWRWYPALMGVLLTSYIGIFAYALTSEPRKTTTSVPQNVATQPSVPLPPPADKRRNPLDSDTAKWRAVSRLHEELANKNLIKCKVVIIRYQLPYAENFADSLKDIFTVLDWPPGESFSTVQRSRGLTVTTSDHVQPEVGRCAGSLQSAFSNATTWRGGTWSPTHRNVVNADCTDCVLLEIGNDPDQP